MRQGPYARKRQAAVRACLGFGAGCLLLDAVPGVDVLGLYLLPPAYLSWIGVGALAFGALAWLDALLRLGPYCYVRDGAPLVVRVVDLIKGPSHIVNGQPTHDRAGHAAARPGEGNDHDHLMSFADARAQAWVCPGRFGWPWVERVAPAPDVAPE